MPKLKRLKKGAFPSSPHPAVRRISDVPAVPISTGAADDGQIRMNTSDLAVNEDFGREAAPGLDLDPLFSYPQVDRSWDAMDRLDGEVNQSDCPSVEPDTEEQARKGKSVKRRLSLEEEGEDPNKRNKRKGKSKKLVGLDGKPKESVREQRRLEKARKAELEQLHAESQRLLRETRDASFKPLKLFNKPVSSVLEKIRLRKQEMLKSSSIFSRSHSMDEAGCSAANSNVNSEQTLCQSHMKGNAENAKEEYTMDSHVRAGDKHLSDVQEAVSVSYLAAPKFKVDDGDDDGNDCAGDLATTGDDNISSSEEENDKENVNPSACSVLNSDFSPKDGCAKAFVDDEAEEEDDSDHDLLRFQESEDEDESDEIEDLYDLIATGNGEAPKDQDKRHELHQKWLEQQDAAETDNVLQRVVVSFQMQEETSLSSPLEDENSREVFGLIKKLNIAPVTKTRGKGSTSAVFDSVLIAGSSNSSSKSSFINRTSNSLSSSHKQGSCSVRTFIFGRDDSNSRSSVSTSEIILDKAQKESKTANNSTNAKSTNSTQQKVYITAAKMQADSSESGSSLFHILRQSSMHFDRKLESSSYLHGEHVVTGNKVAQQFSSFKVRGRSSKMDSRI
ncbi:hypothetical protein AXF42_Ash001533 [Apostasia shenzhenica]|uniref:Uncharacterized protein n=1 Tax=Apostasia shenzhenica TaxID=1088818 RepID=A0A2I0AAH5_9ASPA|nr:hypothetical protein AXF42_Ash001533 [Apostasia shenzhenica]